MLEIVADAKSTGGKMLVKVLDKDLCPPIQGGEPCEIGVWHHCKNFDASPAKCAPGFYVIPVSELIRYHKPWRGTKVLPAEVKGNSKIFSADKQRYEYMKLGNPLSDDEIKALCREIEPELGYKLSEALYPVNPLLLPKATVTDADIELLKQWISYFDSLWYRVRYSVRNSVVRDSVENSVWDSVRYSVWNSVGYSVGYSVENSVWAYIGSLFLNINKWKYKNHVHSQYPFQSAVNLWYRGLLPSFDGKIWILHSGEKAEVVWEEPEAGWLKAQEQKWKP